MRNKRLWTVMVLVVMMLAASVLPAFAQPLAPVTLGNFPHETRIEGGKVLMKGFDLNEYGGNDANCSIPVGGQARSIHMGEVVSSPSEGCRQVLEWSLKKGEITIIAGTYALEPGEWFYVPKAVGGDFGDLRFVGTLWTYPTGWNAHRMAFILAGARDSRDGTLSIVGLSPTDDFVVGLAGTTNPGGGGAPSSGTVQPAAQPAAQPTSGDEVMYCTVTSARSNFVNVRNGPGLNFGVVRTVRTDTEIPYFGQTESGWKIVGEEEFMLGTLCVDAEQADG